MSIQSEFDRLARLYLGASDDARIIVDTGTDTCGYGTCESSYVKISAYTESKYLTHRFAEFSDMINALDDMDKK